MSHFPTPWYLRGHVLWLWRWKMYWILGWAWCRLFHWRSWKFYYGASRTVGTIYCAHPMHGEPDSHFFGLKEDKSKFYSARETT